MGKKLDLKNPQTFNEKLQWLKLYDRCPEYTTMVDKYAVKQWVADRIGEEYIIPTLGVWDSFDDIDFDQLPGQFVLKCTHSSGDVVICKDKSSFDKTQSRAQLIECLNKDLYTIAREWPYKNVPRRIIAEQYMEDQETQELRDYKFFCFNGAPDCVMLCYDRYSDLGTKFLFFDENWELKKYNFRGMQTSGDLSYLKPYNINEMFRLAEVLAKETKAPFLRVDLYEINHRVYFGELTFYPASGFDNNILPEADKYFGNKVRLFDNNF